jgi:serine/threonine protein kinase
VREARLGGLLCHPSLVEVYDVGEADGTWYCAMELVTGRLDDHVPLPPRAVVEVGQQVCEARDDAHRELGLVHLDLKPGNLLLDGATVKVADLGVARAAGEQPLAGRVLGTRWYMAPEQARGRQIDGRADIYALGVTLQHLATGRGPAASVTWTLESHAGAPGEVDAAPVAPWLEAVVRRCTAPRPDDRYASMSEVWQALSELDVDGPGLVELVGRDTDTIEVARVLVSRAEVYVERGEGDAARRALAQVDDLELPDGNSVSRQLEACRRTLGSMGEGRDSPDD